jgi:hypothetical protein
MAMPIDRHFCGFGLVRGGGADLNGPGFGSWSVHQSVTRHWLPEGLVACFAFRGTFGLAGFTATEKVARFLFLISN